MVRQIALHSKKLQREVGLSVPQMMCLRAIASTPGGVTVAAVSAHVHLSPPTVSRIFDRLLAAGLVTRERSTDDRRKVALALTEAGRARLRAEPPALQDAFLRRLDAIPAAERTQLRDALRRVTELMSADELDAAPVLNVDATQT